VERLVPYLSCLAYNHCFLATNTYCVMDGHSSCAPRTHLTPWTPGSNLAVRVNRAIMMTGQAYSRIPSVISGSSSD